MCDYRNNPGLAPRITGITAVARWRDLLVRRPRASRPWITRIFLVLRSFVAPSGDRGSVLLDHRAQAGGDGGVTVLCCVLIDERSPW